VIDGAKAASVVAAPVRSEPVEKYEAEGLMARLSYYRDLSRQIRPVQAAPKIWNYFKYRSRARQPLMFVGRYTPQIAQLFLTKRCNFDCAYCNTALVQQSGRRNWRDSEATVEKVARLFANPLLANCLLVDLVGGEPLFVKELDRIIDYLARRGHLTNMATNGVHLAGRIADLKRAGITRINVSVYDENRSVLERDLTGINRVFPVHASLVLLRSAVEQAPEGLLESARLIHDTGCRSLRLWIYRPMGVDPDPEEIITDTNPAYREFRRRMEEALPGFCVWPAVVRTSGARKLCPQLWQRISCDTLGELGICCGIDGTLQGPNSNVLTGDPDVVFNHPTLVRMREQLLDPGAELPEACKTCNLLGDPGW
jgi:uncharacterized Fe-S cluster-containing radical SAM superfamily protein